MSILDKFRLDGKVAIITGAARGLGQGLSLGLAQAGADIAAVDVIDMAQTKAEVEKLGRKCTTITADLSKTADIPKIIETTVKDLGHIDILCNNAGIILGGRTWSIFRKKTGTM